MNQHLSRLFFLCTVLVSPISLAASNNSWRPITPAEEQFVHLVESQIRASSKCTINDLSLAGLTGFCSK